MSKNVTMLHGLEPQQITNPLSELKKQIEDLKKSFQLKQPSEFMTRQEVADFLKINLTTLWNYTKQGKLTAYGINSRVLYKRSEVVQSLIKLNY